MWTRKELKDRTKQVMTRSYGKMFVAALFGSFIYGIVNMDVESITYEPYIALILGVSLMLLGVFAANPISVGVNRFFVLNAQENAKLSEVFSMFKYDYWNVVKVMLMQKIKIVLWTFCFIIPGIIKAYEYSMIPFILAEDSSTSMDECFARSKEMTRNQKMEMFILDCSFVGWLLLGLMAFGIGTLFVAPYVSGTQAELYIALKDREKLPDLPA